MKKVKKKRIKFDENKGKKLKLIFGFFLVCIGLICCMLIYIKESHGEDYEKSIMRQQNYSSSILPFCRGTITDRNSTVLATSERIYTMILDPKSIKSNRDMYLDATVTALYEVYGYDINEMKTLFIENEDKAYIRYRKEMSEEEKTAFTDYQTKHNSDKALVKAEGRVAGVWFEESYKRVYPFDNFACTLLGFSGSDSSRGNWGIEEYYNSELTGKNGKEYGYINTDGEAERNVIPAQGGNTIVSTIDFSIQQVVEEAIAEFQTVYTAKNIAAIVMDPNSAEILAMATDKSYNLNNPSDISAYYTEEEIAAMTDEELSEARANIWKNFTIADSYEPGSTAKPFTIAAALEEGTISKEATFLCEGYKVFGSGSNETKVRCSHVHNSLDLTGAIAYSCNSALMEVAGKLGVEKFSNFQTVFGFGRQSGIDLPGETSGIIYTADKMKQIDLATNSFGQSFNVNMVQLASAFASLVNGGNYYQPHIVKQIKSSDGKTIKNIEPTLVRQTVSKDTSEWIKKALVQTIEVGTGKNGAIDGYLIGAKTGTAEKLPRSDKKYLLSFIAVTPADDPKLLVYVVVDDPSVKETELNAIEEIDAEYSIDEEISARLAIKIEKEIMENVIPYMNITPVDPAAAKVSLENAAKQREERKKIAEEIKTREIKGADSSQNTEEEAEDD